MLTLNRLTLGLSLALCAGVFLEGREAQAGVPEASAPAKKPKGSGVLTKEEVGAIIGAPITEVEVKTDTITYKTASIFFEASIQIEHGDPVGDMDGARNATAFLGGTCEAVPGLGDEAFFGAMSTLYVRKGDSLASIDAPNYQMEAQAKAADKYLKAPPDEAEKAGEELLQVAKDNPVDLTGKSSMKETIGVVNKMSKKQGTVYEARTRATAVALAKKLMEKL